MLPLDDPGGFSRERRHSDSVYVQESSDTRGRDGTDIVYDEDGGGHKTRWGQSGTVRV